MGSLARTGVQHGPTPEPGGIAWVQPSIASGALENAKSIFGMESQMHLQSHPVTDGTRVFVAAMESLRAFDLNSGNILWTQTWAGAQTVSAGNPNAAFNGFPSSCPLLNAGAVVVRAQSLTSSLKCFDAATGALRWSSDTQPELKKLVWISDAAAAYGMIFAVWMEPGDFNVHGVAALDAETGRLRWRTPLVSGSPGIKVTGAYFQTSTQLGPPALDAGELYVETGLASLAALNAFSGEPRWLSSYPRAQFGDLHRGNSGLYEVSMRAYKTFSRGPLSPMIAGNLIAASPHDTNGVMAFDRRDGSLIWQRELIDCRYIAGIAGGKILACDDGISALDLETGVTAWHTESDARRLQSEPTLSGGTLYLPMRSGLQRMDALTGKIAGTSPWDGRMGPIGNLLIGADRIVGVSEQAVVALGTGAAGTSALPLYEAKRLEAEGKLEEAAQRYAAAQAAEKNDLSLALTSRIRVLKKLGKRDEALAEIARFEREAPMKLSALGGLWVTQKDAVVRSLRISLGENIPAVDAAGNGDGLAGVPAYSAFIPGRIRSLRDF